MFYGRKMHIQRNEIHDAPYSGMIGGGKDHLIEQNLIYRVMRELHDGAAIYGNMNNCIIRGNVVRDVVEVGKGFGASAYYLDEGARDCVIERNVAQGVPMPTHNHITRNITVRDNVFIADKDMTVSFQRSVGCTFERNTLFVPGKLSVRQPNGIKVWKDNVIFQNGLGKDDSPQAFTIGDAMPTAPAPDRKTWPAEAVRVAAAPALDGEITPAEWPGKIQTLDREPSRHNVGGAPVLAKFSYDDQCLYVSANVTMFAPAKVSTGSAWGTGRRRGDLHRGPDTGRQAGHLCGSRLRGRRRSERHRRRRARGGGSTAGQRGAFRGQAHQGLGRHPAGLARRMGHPFRGPGIEARSGPEGRLQHGRVLQRVRRVALLGRHARRELAPRPGRDDATREDRMTPCRRWHNGDDHE